MLYHTVLADPPWLERGGGKIKRGADRHYPLLKTDQIAAMPVAALVEPNAHLYLWVTNNHLPDGLEVMRAWGFKYKTMITWAKDRMGIGQYFRGMTEHVLFGVRGNIPYRFKQDGKRAQGRTLITAPKGAHSQKPEELRSMIQVVSPGPYLELFAREIYPGWHCWGNEVKSDIVMPDLWSAQDTKFTTSPYSSYDCQFCGESRNGYENHYCPKKVKCPGYDMGCRTMIYAGEAMCPQCFKEYQEDPDAFK